MTTDSECSLAADAHRQLQLLQDERSVLRTMYMYGHGLDYNLDAEYSECWVDNATLYWGAAVLAGRDAIMAAFREHTHAPAAYHKHLVIEPLIEIDGDRATAASYYVRLDVYPDGPKIRSYGRYRDAFVRCDDGHWRFSERRAEVEALLPHGESFIQVPQYRWLDAIPDPTERQQSES